jgi:uncharacterized protein (DUF4415 family)
MNDEPRLRELAQVIREEKADRFRLDERWARLSSGELSEQEEAELRALAEVSLEARQAYEAFRPLGPEFQARMVQILRQRLATVNPWGAHRDQRYDLRSYFYDPSRKMDEDDDQELVRRALAREEDALTRLVAKLTPVIQRRVARCLLLSRWGAAKGRNVRQEVEDQTQDVFVHLFDKGEKVLRVWKLERGLPLDRFVDLVTKRFMIARLRPGPRRPWRDEPTPEDEFEGPEPAPGPDVIFASKEEQQLLLKRLEEELSPLGWHLFEILFLRELTVPEVVALTGLSEAAIYQWRSRLRRLARRLLEEIRNGPGPAN